MLSMALLVADLEASTAFYHDVLGLQISEVTGSVLQRSWVSGRHIEVIWREGAQLRLALVQVDDAREPTTRVDLCFMLDDVETMHRELVAKGVPVVHEPRVWNDVGGLVARYLDPDGNSVGFVSIIQ
jgi:catechol 2,3-dioxygenase-like lactoylglutathione lyase family enzyme